MNDLGKAAMSTVLLRYVQLLDMKPTVYSRVIVSSTNYTALVLSLLPCFLLPQFSVDGKTMALMDMMGATTTNRGAKSTKGTREEAVPSQQPRLSFFPLP